MQHVNALQRDSMVEFWRDRLPTLIAVAVALLLAAGLLALIWIVIHSPEPKRPESKIVQLLLVPSKPTQRPPEPAREAVRMPLPPPPIPVRPKKPVVQHRDSVAAVPTPRPKPAPPQPKTRSPSVADPLSLDAPPDWRQYALPQGPSTGTVIGGDGENGGGSGCGGASAFMPIVASQIRTVFSRDEKMDGRTFHVQAELWFDDSGTVQRSQLLQTTGKADLDASIRTLLGKINIGPGMPQCVQPIRVWVNQPDSGGSSVMPLDAYRENWQSRSRPRN